MNIKKINFNDFIVFKCDECHSFFHIEIKEEGFYEKMFDYFFDESRLLRYIENKVTISFKPTLANYVSLYKNLSKFIDEENCIPLPKVEQEILDIINEEYKVVEENGEKKIRLDKIGKIGEYIFCNLLSEFFKFECIIPKLALLTDPNMNIYGIDTLFYSSQEKLILFGESKVSKSLDNGIALINKSLFNYQKQVDDEFELVLSNRWYKNNLGSFIEDFGDDVEISLSMSDFITRAGIKKIGIPIFIAHGGEDDLEAIMLKLKKINKINLYGLETMYISISLPLIDKEKFFNIFTECLASRREMYELAAKVI
ncbi:MAG: DUF1837 domain-containing protein [Clostridia bacterium]|nr:DUF1837 domain-containing protein [Clostridia bacterium]